MIDERDRRLVLGNLVEAVTLLRECREFSTLVPEVRVNLAFALPEARSASDVAAIEGRITVVCGYPYPAGTPGWGASDHMARLILEARNHDPGIHAGINFKCDNAIIEVVREYCADSGLSFGWIDRSHEPEEIIERDGASMPWKIKHLVATYGHIPRVFFEGPGWGKEPLFVVLGPDATEVALIAVEIARRFRAVSEAS
ncbi:MAG: phosphomethylpyrimidine kinase [Dehalococcoidia bacterium]|nr:phosphomethylpyrimidine kinase [Dehalococcoidia bacterium]